MSHSLRLHKSEFLLVDLPPMSSRTVGLTQDDATDEEGEDFADGGAAGEP